MMIGSCSEAQQMISTTMALGFYPRKIAMIQIRFAYVMAVSSRQGVTGLDRSNDKTNL